MREDYKKALTDWGQYRRALLDDTFINPDESEADKLKRRAELEANPPQWFKYFFPKFAKADFAPFHLKAIKRILNNPEWYEVLSWSRELSKSTIVMFCVLYLVLTGKKRNIILASNSYENAVRLLEPYRANLDTNPRIMAYYGNQKNLGSWEAGEFTTTAGASFRALGAGQSPRGSRNQEIRPDTLLIDDFDTDEDTKNPAIISKKWEWFENALYPTRSISEPLLIVFCGNIISKNCCIVRAGEKSDFWDIVNIRDKEGRSTWAAKNSEEQIDRVLSKISEKAIQAEYYNNPVLEGETFQDLRFEKIPPLEKFPFLVVYGDPAQSNSKKAASSTKAAVLVGFLNGKYYIINAFVNRETNAEFVNWYYLLNEYVNGRTPVYNYIENNSLQNPFFEQVFKPLFNQVGQEKGYINIIPDGRKKPDKFARIEGNLQPLDKNGALLFNQAEKENPHFKRLENQFKLIAPGLPAPADAVDAIEGAIFKIKERAATIATNSIQFGKRPKNKKRF